MNEDVLTPVEFARQSGLTLGYVYSLVWTGRLNAQKVAGAWEIPAPELESVPRNSRS